MFTMVASRTTISCAIPMIARIHHRCAFGAADPFSVVFATPFGAPSVRDWDI